MTRIVNYLAAALGSGMYRLSCRTAAHDERLGGNVGYLTSALCNGGNALGLWAERDQPPSGWVWEDEA